VQTQLAQAQAYRIDVAHRHRAGGKQRDLAPRAGVVQLDGLAPGFALAGVDLAQVEHLALHDSAIAAPAVLRHAPVLVVLAVLPASVAAQEHARGSWPPEGLAARTKVAAADLLAEPDAAINGLQVTMRSTRRLPTEIRE